MIEDIHKVTKYLGNRFLHLKKYTAHLNVHDFLHKNNIYKMSFKLKKEYILKYSY